MNTLGRSAPRGYAPFAMVSATSTFLSVARSQNVSSKSPPLVHRIRVILGNAARHVSASSKIDSARVNVGTRFCKTAATSPPKDSQSVSLHALGTPATAAANEAPPAGVTVWVSGTQSVTLPAPVPISTATRNKAPTFKTSSAPLPVLALTRSTLHGAILFSTASSSQLFFAFICNCLTLFTDAALLAAPPSTSTSLSPFASAACFASCNKSLALAMEASHSPLSRCAVSIATLRSVNSCRNFATLLLLSASATSAPSRVRNLCASRDSASPVS
mmetsp:Transcript_3393/g.11729  ORF Transcript_3393/g.11729 Transcript_3393/m.11729 type:complete len:274 (+) Transcript_3393:894-1715(+)